MWYDKASVYHRPSPRRERNPCQAPSVQARKKSEMNLETLSDKQISELERLAKELLAVMKQGKLNDEPLSKALQSLALEAGNIRCTRFDVANPRFRGY